MEDVENRIRDFIINNFLFGEETGLDNDTSFLAEGIIDSTGVLELVEFLTHDFSMTIADDELIPENLDSISNITHFLHKKLSL